MVGKLRLVMGAAIASQLNMENNQQFSLGIKHQLFNNEVRKRRLAMGLFQKELAEKCGLKDQTISNIETFRTYPSDYQAEQIAKILGCKVETLFPGWIETLKDKKTSITTEHLVTERLLDHPELKLLPAETGGMEEIERELDLEALKKMEEKVLGTLSDREKKVLKMRFGLENDIPSNEIKKPNGRIYPDYGVKTLEEVAKQFGVTRERIRQIERKALRRLRHPSRSKQLRTFL